MGFEEISNSNDVGLSERTTAPSSLESVDPNKLAEPTNTDVTHPETTDGSCLVDPNKLAEPADASHHEIATSTEQNVIDPNKLAEPNNYEAVDYTGMHRNDGGEVGYTTKIDRLGRTKSIEGKLHLTERKERLPMPPRDQINKPFKEGDHRGHLIADRFDGPADVKNIVPMDSHVNQSDFKKLENKWADALKDNKDVRVKIQPRYKGNSPRPHSFRVTYTIDGEMKKETISNDYKGSSK